MIDGEMQAFALTLDKFLEHAAKWRPSAQVVTARDDGRIDRIGYADLKVRSLRASAALAEMGVGQGDRVATLAWNTQNHVEVWYAIMGIGAVCHTLNPRLTAGHLAAMIVQSEARVLIASADLAVLARQILDGAPGVERLLIIDAGDDAATDGELLEPLVAAARGEVAWGAFDETAPSGLCFTSGTTGAPKGEQEGSEWGRRAGPCWRARRRRRDPTPPGRGDRRQKLYLPVAARQFRVDPVLWPAFRPGGRRPRRLRPDAKPSAQHLARLVRASRNGG